MPELDVSLELSSVCIANERGAIVLETKVPSEPEDLVRYFEALEHPVIRIALEAGPLSQWIHAGLTAAGFEAALLETRHVRAALSAMTAKTDRRDARAIAQLLRLGWFRPVHAKSENAQEVRSLPDRPQADPGQAARHRVRDARGAARARLEGWSDQPRPL
jgi:transposase